MTEQYDVVVVGGGAAGLSGALTLARARRRVLVVDAGQPRNAPAHAVHAYLGLDGTPPAELSARGRDEVTRYGGVLTPGEVVAARATGDVTTPRFTVTLDDGREVSSRRLLVTTGLVDELPDVPGLRERWGHDVLHCPYCHGWEVRDQRLVVLAGGPMSVHQALLFRQWSEHVTLLLHTAGAPTPEEAEQLAARGVDVVDRTARGLVVDGDALRGVLLDDGTTLPCDALVVGPRFTARSAVLESLGVTPEPFGPPGAAMGTHVPADPSGATSVPGVHVAGNVTDLSAQVVHAAAAGNRAAAFLNADLVTEDTRAAVAQ
ncbi:NAD(P)/FAD-dependent oxidoreductase [Thalassiella azotivora]